MSRTCSMYGKIRNEYQILTRKTWEAQVQLDYIKIFMKQEVLRRSNHLLCFDTTHTTYKTKCPAILLKSTVSWDITPCCLLKVITICGRYSSINLTVRDATDQEDQTPSYPSLPPQELGPNQYSFLPVCYGQFIGRGQREDFHILCYANPPNECENSRHPL